MLLLCFLLGSLACSFASIDSNPADLEARKQAALLSNQVPDQENANSVLCPGCVDVFQELKTLLSDPTVIAKIKTTLKQVCPYFGGAEQDCINLIDDDLMSLIHQIQPLIADPHAACTKLHLCSSDSELDHQTKIRILRYSKRLMAQLRTQEASSILCDECTYVVEEAKKMFDNPETQASVKDWLEHSCSELGSLKDECKQLIDENFSTIVGLIDNVLGDPKGVCGEIGLCDKSQNRLWFMRRPNIDVNAITRNMPHTKNALNRLRSHHIGRASAGCTTCKFFMQIFESFLMNSNATLMAMVDGVQKICAKFPNDVNLQCHDFVGIYLKPVIQMTVKTYLQPDEVCKLLTACTGAQLSFLNELQRNRVGRVGNEIECMACKEIFALLKQELSTQAVKQEINDGLIKLVCDHINPQYKDQCGSIINGYFPQIWQVIDDAIDADAICKDMKACPN